MRIVELKELIFSRSETIMKKGKEEDWKTPEEILKKYEPFRNQVLLHLSPEQIKKNGEFEIDPKYDIVEVVG